MDRSTAPRPADSAGNAVIRAGKRSAIGGVPVREDDIDTQPGLNVATLVLHVCAVVTLLLAGWQVYDWVSHRPPGGGGVGLLAGETVRLVVLAGLLWAAGSLATMLVQSHHDMRASRILLARQTYLMQQMGIAQGVLPFVPEGDRRGHESRPPGERAS